MDDLLPFPNRQPQAASDDPFTEEAWQQAGLHGEAVPAVAHQYHIDDLQHWLDLSA
jgi:hypothetical protein